MTRKQTIEAVKALGLRCTYDPDAKEYRVAYNLGPLPGGRGSQAAQREREEASAYYTSDKQDALNTARAMLAHKPS